MLVHKTGGETTHEKENTQAWQESKTQPQTSLIFSKFSLKPRQRNEANGGGFIFPLLSKPLSISFPSPASSLVPGPSPLSLADAPTCPVPAAHSLCLRPCNNIRQGNNG